MPNNWLVLYARLNLVYSYTVYPIVVRAWTGEQRYLTHKIEYTYARPKHTAGQALPRHTRSAHRVMRSVT